VVRRGGAVLDRRRETPPATLVQPIAAADVAQAAADVSVGAPLGMRNVAGPEVFALDELDKITLDAHGDHRTVITDNSAGMSAAASGNALIPTGGAVIAETTYREWLARAPNCVPANRMSRRGEPAGTSPPTRNQPATSVMNSTTDNAPTSDGRTARTHASMASAMSRAV